MITRSSDCLRARKRERAKTRIDQGVAQRTQRHRVGEDERKQKRTVFVPSLSVVCSVFSVSLYPLCYSPFRVFALSRFRVLKQSGSRSFLSAFRSPPSGCA